MAKNDSQFIAILDREFERIRKGNKKVGHTDAQMAGHIGIPASTFSHYRTGKRPLSKAAAQDIAKALRPMKEFDDAQRAELAKELVDACAKETSRYEASAEDWLENIGKEGPLLFVEFRDFPSARPSNPNLEVARGMAKKAGQAVAKGLVYALLNPFPPSYESNAQIQIELRSYVAYLSKHIADAYKNILKEAYRQIRKNLPNEDASAIRSSFSEVQKRLRVYRLKDGRDTGSPLDCCPGLGYKLFYLRENVGKPAELWYWLSTPDGETLVRNDMGEPDRMAIESRFFPLLECAETFLDMGYFRLPDDAEMAKKAGERQSLWALVDAISADGNDILIDEVLNEKGA